MRVGITITGVVVLVLGLILLGAGRAYSNLTSEWLGGVISLIGFVTGVVGAGLKKH
jgi:hypothetical protein